MSKKTRVERFDEAFRTLIVIMTISFSASLAFFKDVMEPRFFLYTGSMYIATIVIWTVSTLHGGRHEYFLKSCAWWFLIVSFGVLFERMYFTKFLLPPLAVSPIVLVGLMLTLPILSYLKEAMEDIVYRTSRWMWVSVTLLLVILDILYFFGLFVPTG